jgi:hypothetical protein
MLETGRLGENMELTTCSPLLFSQGSFVDVAVSIDIVVRTLKKGRRGKSVPMVRVYLNLLHVLLMAVQETVSIYQPLYMACRLRACLLKTDTSLDAEGEDVVQYSSMTFGLPEMH